MDLFITGSGDPEENIYIYYIFINTHSLFIYMRWFNVKLV